MSKNHFGTSHSRPGAFANSKPKDPREEAQVSALYELGLLTDTNKKGRRREKDRVPGGSRVAGSQSKKGQFKQCLLLFLVRFANDMNSFDRRLTEFPLPGGSTIAASRKPTTPSSTVKPWDSTSKTSRDLRNRSGNQMAGMLSDSTVSERSRTRRERTFVGSECAVCEEPLEHTLRGERILQFSCGHVSHEACFYEYIKEFESQYCPTCNAPLGLDTSRGGNVLDIGKNCRLM
jgi:hypothetical protein